jgi:hypothetical protein
VKASDKRREAKVRYEARKRAAEEELLNLLLFQEAVLVRVKLND